MSHHVGIDFGTTNSAIAVAGEGEPVLARFPREGGFTSTFRSVLYFDPEHRNARGAVVARSGPTAIDAWIESHGDGRLIQSLKSHVASRVMTGTSILGRNYTIEDLVTLLVKGLRAGADAQFSDLGARAVVGRPVRFSNAETPDDEELALTRLRTAFSRAGFTDVIFEYEPVGAAWYYESSLDHDELVLIADFGGGTSDFCLMRVGPGVRRRGRSPNDILGTEGVALAGDAFDSEIVEQVISPHLGMGSQYRSYMDGKIMDVPGWIFGKLRRWHHLSFLKSKETMHFLHELRAQTLEPRKIAGLLHLVEDDLGYAMYKTVEETKVALSRAAEAPLTLDDAPIAIDERVARRDFEGWIADELRAIDACVARLLANTGVAVADVDRVFLTGGSSFVPAVRRLFEARFGEARLRSGDELTSVALGLALRARDLAR